MSFPRAVLFDLLTALLDSWTLWDSVAGSERAGRSWRAEYLRLTYGSDAYVPYEELVRAAARATGLPEAVPDVLEARWSNSRHGAESRNRSTPCAAGAGSRLSPIARTALDYWRPDGCRSSGTA